MMPPDDGAQHGVPIRGLEGALGSLLAELVRQEAAQVARRVVAEALASGDRSGVEWATQESAGDLAGVTPQTIRGWQATGKLSKGRRGRVNLAELRAFLAKADDQVEPVVLPEHQDEFRQERARRAAREILRVTAARAKGVR